MTSQLITGAGVALITPFKSDNSIDYLALEKIVDEQINGGMDYLVVLGTTAETPTLSLDEKQSIVRYIVDKTAGRLPIVVGLGGNNTKVVIENINQFNLEGVDGLLIVTPFYNKPTQTGLFEHYKSILEETPLPVILYNVPSRTGANLDADTVIKLANKYDKVAGIKEASGDLCQISKIIKYTPEHFTTISGDDALALPIISIGGNGLISVIANGLPDILSTLVHTATDGNLKNASKLHLEIFDMIQLIFKEGNPAGIKALLNIRGIIENVLRLPLCPVNKDTFNSIKDAYDSLKHG